MLLLQLTSFFVQFKYSWSIVLFTIKTFTRECTRKRVLISPEHERRWSEQRVTRTARIPYGSIVCASEQRGKRTARFPYGSIVCASEQRVKQTARIPYDYVVCASEQRDIDQILFSMLN